MAHRDKISTDTATFLGSSSSMKLFRISREFNFRLPVTSGSIRDSAIELLDPENVGVAVGTAMLSSLDAEI